MKLRLPLAPPKDGEAPATLAPLDREFRGNWEWVQPGRFRKPSQLTCDGTPVATLTMRGLFQAGSTARFADATWEMRYRFPADVIVTRAGEPEPWGRFRTGWLGGGRLRREHAAPLVWGREGFWGMTWTFSTEDGLVLVRFRPRHEWLRRGSAVELEDAARRMDDLPVLLALGWWLLLRHRRGHSSHL